MNTKWKIKGQHCMAITMQKDQDNNYYSRIVNQGNVGQNIVI